MIAETMGMSERDLKELVTLSTSETNSAAISTLFLISETGDRQELKELLTQFEAFTKTRRAQNFLRKEYVRRDRETHENQRVTREQALLQEQELLRRYTKAKRESAAKTAIPDAPGHDCKPDPLDADSPEEFVDTMRRYRAWAGNPSLRAMARRCNQRFSHSTFANFLKASTLPEFDMVDAFVTALGGTEEDKSRWISAWRSFTIVPQEAGNRNVTPLRLTVS